MPKLIDRTPISVKRGKGGTGGDAVPTRLGIQMHRDYVMVNLQKGQERVANWSVKEKRAKQHSDGVARHPEFSGMTPIQLERFIKDAEAEFWLADQQVQFCKSELARLERLLR